MARFTFIGQRVGNVELMFIRRLCIFERRFEKVCYAHGRSGTVVQIEPWSIVLTDQATEKILSFEDGLRCAAVKK